MDFLSAIFATRQLRALKALLAALLAAAEMLGLLLFDLPTTPRGPALDLSKFELVWADEFNGDELDVSKWSPHFTWGSTIRRGGWWNTAFQSVGGGSLKIRTEYQPEGFGGGQPSYYSCAFDTNGRYLQKFGYFEVRCMLPKGQGQWAAFWMLNDGMFQVDGSGRDGMEIDIFEAPYYHKNGLERNAVTTNIHYDGYGSGHRMEAVGKFRVPDPYDTFNTYGLEWNEHEYIFYINGVETARSTFGGVSQEPEYMILSVEVDGSGGVPAPGWSGDIRNNTLLPSAFVVDYVRVYQYKDLADGG